ncbi:hypothetical protein ABPG74_022624 [Tetrahymena malaccensis]
MQKLQKLDFFSQQFSFLVGPQKKKKTTEGALYTITAFSLSLGYLLYLLVLFFDNKFLPKITTKIKNQTNLQDIYLSQSVFGFTFSSNGQTLQQLQQSTGKQYLTFKAQKTYISLQQQQQVDLPIADCTDQNFLGYLCLDYSNMTDEQKTLLIDPTTQAMSQYILTVEPCTGLPTCASPTEIQNKIIDNGFQFYMKLRIIQYNEQSQNYEQGFSIDLIQFDDSLSIQNQYQLTQSVNTINQGFLFQNQSVSKFISGYQKSTSYYSPNNLLKKAGFNGYAQFLFFLQQSQEINYIQYPLVTEALAQFMPVVNILFTIGIITRLFSESKIVENLNTLFLKEYYRSTALKLISSRQKDDQLKLNQNNNQSKINELKKADQKIDKNELYGINQIADTKQNSNNPLTADQIIGLQYQIDENEFQNEEKSKFQANFFQFYKQYFFGRIIKQTSEKDVLYQNMCNFTKRSIDIFQLYRNMLKVNMAIKMLLSKEQFAALQFCGCEMDLELTNMQKNSTSTINNIQNQMSKNQENLDKQQSNNNQITQVIISPAQVQQDLEEGKSKKISHQNDEVCHSLNQIAPIESDLPLSRQVNDSYIKQISKNKEYQLHLKKNDNQSTNFELPTLSKSNQISNHLQQQEEILTNKHMLHLYLKKFIDRINKNQELTQVDLNIYSSLIGSEPKV